MSVRGGLVLFQRGFVSARCGYDLEKLILPQGAFSLIFWL